MNLLSKADVKAENKLFATVDATVRKVVVGDIPFLLPIPWIYQEAATSFDRVV